MLPTPIKTVITSLRDLMLWPPEAETVDDIKATVEPIIGGYGHKNLYYDIVRTGRRLWISVYTVSYTHLDVYKRQSISSVSSEC